MGNSKKRIEVWIPMYNRGTRLKNYVELKVPSGDSTLRIYYLNKSANAAVSVVLLASVEPEEST